MRINHGAMVSLQIRLVEVPPLKEQRGCKPDHRASRENKRSAERGNSRNTLTLEVSTHPSGVAGSQNMWLRPRSAPWIFRASVINGTVRTGAGEGVSIAVFPGKRSATPDLSRSLAGKDPGSPRPRCVASLRDVWRCGREDGGWGVWRWDGELR